jgi:hypothetical protein
MAYILQILGILVLGLTLSHWIIGGFLVGAVVLLIFCGVAMSIKKSRVPNGQIVSDPLTRMEKTIIWILALLNPVITGLVFEYGWKKKLPQKSIEAGRIERQAFGVVIILAFLLWAVLAIVSGLRNA